MTSDEMREKIFREVLDYAEAYGFEGENGEKRLATRQALYQNDGMQIDGLTLVGDLLDILNGKS